MLPDDPDPQSGTLTIPDHDDVTLELIGGFELSVRTILLLVVLFVGKVEWSEQFRAGGRGQLAIGWNFPHSTPARLLAGQTALDSLHLHRCRSPARWLVGHQVDPRVGRQTGAVDAELE